MHTSAYRTVIGESPIRLFKGGEKISSNDFANALDAVVEGGFDEALKTAELVGKTFTINALPRSHTNQFGTSWIADIEIEGENREAWLSGVILNQQIEGVLTVEGVLPKTVTLVRESSIPGDPFRLMAVE